MRIFVLLILVIITSAGFSQSYKPAASKLAEVQLKDSSIPKKWFVTKYSSLSAGFMAFKGGSASVFSAPMGIQLNRSLSQNVFAFAGVEIAPSYIMLNQRTIGLDASKPGFSNSFLSGSKNMFSVNPAAFIGLGYTNDQHTFQIQGRISVQQNNLSNPVGFRNFGSSSMLQPMPNRVWQ